MKIHVIIGFLLVAAVIRSEAKLFPTTNWFKFPWFSKSLPEMYEERPKIVEIIKHVPVIQKIEVIKPVEIIKTVEVPVEVIKQVEVIKYVPIIQEVIKEVPVIQNMALPQEVIKEVEIIKEIPVIKTVEVPKPYEIVKHVPVLKEVEKPVEKKAPFMAVHKYTKQIQFPQIPLPSLPNVKELFHHHYETPLEAPVESEAPEHKVHQMSWQKNVKEQV